MSWTELDPIVQTVPNVKSSVVINKDGKTRVNISFSEPFYREIGEPKACVVQAGSGENAGKVKLTFSGGGKFSVREYGKGGARLQIPAPECVPARVREQEAGEILSRDKNVVIIGLPLEAWAKQGAPAPKPAMERTQASAPKPPPAAPFQKIDACEYLTRRGARCVKHGSGFKVDGSVESRAGTLTIINRHRRASGLEPVGMDDFE